MANIVRDIEVKGAEGERPVLYTLALAGNPNSGKTTLFNRLTGSRQKVGNYPGATVESKNGICRTDAGDVLVVDLPGAYSFTTGSPEESVTRDFLLTSPPDVVVQVVDATVLERHLYLTVQLRELGVPLVLALNMVDLARKRGLSMDVQVLSQRLGVPVVEIAASSGEGVTSLLQQVHSVAGRERPAPFVLPLDSELEALVSEAESALRNRMPPECPPRWAALQWLEKGGARFWMPDEEMPASLREASGRLDVAAAIAGVRYAEVSRLVEGAVEQIVPHRVDRTERLDAILTHRFLGIPIFLLAMLVVFVLTFELGRLPVEALEAGFGWVRVLVGNLLPAGSLLRSALLDGVLAGIGGVVVFLPNILILFMAISLLEDSGYLPRAAFLMDRAMNKVGLHGKSFIPMLLGFGCSVPAIMATRTIESRRDRLATMLIVPLMSCGARLPIYALVIPAFFPSRWQGPMLWLIYLTGVLLALGVARLLRATLFKGDTTPFILELPPYRIPTIRSVLLHMMEQTRQYLRKVGTVILGISLVMWAMASLPRRASGERLTEAQRLERSLAGQVGKAMEPALAPLGFDWRIGTALLGAVGAKEAFVSQLAIVFSTGGEAGGSALRQELRKHYPPRVGVGVLLFCLIAAPCMGTLAATRRESGSWRWALLQWGGLTMLGYLAALLANQSWWFLALLP